jgi:cytochrome c biogenesis protein
MGAQHLIPPAIDQPHELEMAQASAQPNLARRPIAEIIVDRIWRFFCSVRAAVFEIAALGILVLIGTLRGSSVPEWIADAVPATRGIVDRWYAWDVFHSLPFIFLLTLISVAIAICTVNRVPGMWKSIAYPTIVTSHGYLRNAEVNAEFDCASSIETTAGRVQALLRKRRYRVLSEARGGEVHVYADRFRFAKLGTYPFHLALILILVGGIVGARYGFRETEFVIPEGEVRDVGHGTGLSVGLSDFRDTYRENGSPLEYRSDLVVYKDGKPVKSGSITVNHPLSYGHMTLYQSDFGQAVTLRVTDSAGNMVYEGSVPLGLFQSRLNPDAPAGVLDLPPLNAAIHVIGPDNNPANQPELDNLGLRSGEMFVQYRPVDLPAGVMPPSAVVGQGDTAQLGGLNITFVRERQFTLLQVANNPGMPIFWTAAFLLVGGLGVVFYFPHRRIRGIIHTSSAGATCATFAPLAKRDWSGQRTFLRLCDDLADTLGVRANINQQQVAGDGSDEDQLAPPEKSSNVAIESAG